MRFSQGQWIGQGRYYLLSLLGRGGQAEVWLAEQQGAAGFAREVVLKLLLPQDEDGPEDSHRLLLEAQLASQLYHPNIVQIYDVGQEGDGLFLAMEKIDGLDLSSLLRARLDRGQGGFPWAVVAWIAREICEALEYAHEKRDSMGRKRGLIHRDIKPHNILVSREGFPKLIDFGIAKPLHSATHTATGAIKGTPAYMSPEHLQAQKLDGRTDLYSLGVVMFELCAGSRPFVQDDIFVLIQEIISQPAPPLELPDAPAPWGELVGRLLCKQPEQRFQDAGALAAALGELLREVEMDRKLLARELFGNALLEQGLAPTVEHIISTEDVDIAPSSPSSSSLAGSKPTRDLKAEDEAPPTRPGPPSTGSRWMWLNWVLVVGLVLFLVGERLLSPKERTGPSAAKRRAAGQPDASAMKRGAKASRGAPSVPELRKKAAGLRRSSGAPQRRTAPGLKKRSSPRSPARRRPARRRPGSRRRAMGWVRIFIAPLCKLYRGRRYLGPSTGLRVKAPVGLVRLRCVAAKARLARRLVLKIPKAGATVTYRRSFGLGTLFVLSFPWAEVHLSPFGKIGVSQEFLKLPEGRHRIVLYKGGHRSHRKPLVVRVRRGKVTRTPVIRWAP